ncbi:monosaccharide ABC transporter membrane protein, CUT2 family [Jatrophihabitans endophyticus]|uniref:Monosaccharide ABC transporter membrane protein, CUT2 family n=1 Tax=Jatrophihabitans endophyticus TaxID=1206085 RepID=A0A1M5RQF3_9ACTN|nr:ABC transporter permease [Jatrophihabitans endophyticus]SHH28527.1 monosaccharide ABC transporter membrane protein, CUT2 family [Jatrophihabitans endophyticus]
MTDTSHAVAKPASTDPSPEPPAGTSTPGRRLDGGSAVQFLERYALLVITAAVAVFFAVTSPASEAFPTLDNANVVLGNNAVTALIALAALFPLVSGFFDFSIGSVAILTSVLCAGLQTKTGLPLWLAIVIPMAVSIGIGLVNGLLVTTFRMSPFVTTLGMATLLTGITTWYCSGTTFTLDSSSSLISFGSQRWIQLPVVFFVVLIVAAVVWYFFRHTPYGRSLYAIGSNVTSARLVGMPVDRNVRFAFVASSTISGFAGIVELARQGSATAVDGGSLLFPALAAVFLGATAITPGFFNVVGTIVSAIFVSITVSGLTLMGASGWVTNVFNGAALLVAVGLSTWLGRRKLRGKA